jgi:flagellar basal body-associated protein FliL
LKQELGQNSAMRSGRLLAIAFVILGVATIVGTVVAVVWMARSEAAQTTTVK